MKRYNNYTWEDAQQQLCQAAYFFEPNSEAELAAVVHKARWENKNITIVGSGYSTLPTLKKQTIALSTKGLNEIVEIDVERQQVRCQAGVLLNDLAKALVKAGLVLDTIHGHALQTVGEAVMSGTASNGFSDKNMSTSVVALRCMNGRGEVVEVSKKEQLEVLCLSMGLLGVVLEVTLQCQPLYTVCKEVVEMSMEEGLDYLKKEGLDKIAGQFIKSGRMQLFQYRPIEKKDYAEALENGAQLGNAMSFVLKEQPFLMKTISYAVPVTSYRSILKSLAALLIAHPMVQIDWSFSQKDKIWLSPAYQQDVVFIRLGFLSAFYQCNAVLLQQCQQLIAEHMVCPNWVSSGWTIQDLERYFPKWQDFLRVKAKLDPYHLFKNFYWK